jgi:hypothetical protein
LLEAETRLAISALGMDPGLGLGLHTDTANRDSLVFDVLEPGSRLGPVPVPKELACRSETSHLRLLHGQPLRQLLNRFFPHLYWWVSDTPDNSNNDLGPPVGPPPAIDSPLPRTDEMNVTLWSNAYRSGDYVGRSLWVGQWLERNEGDDMSLRPDVARADAPQSCTEMCIGLGAHTHYWDRTATDVAKQLDQLITVELQIS